jgi:hypothetical protein
LTPIGNLEGLEPAWKERSHAVGRWLNVYDVAAFCERKKKTVRDPTDLLFEGRNGGFIPVRLRFGALSTMADGKIEKLISPYHVALFFGHLATGTPLK